MLESRGVLSKFSSTEELQSWNVTQFDGPWSKMEYLCSLRDIPTPVAAVLNEDRIAVIVAVLTELTLKLHTGTKVAMRWFLARATKLWLDGTSVSLLVRFQFLYALPFWAKQLLTSSGKKEAISLAVLSLSVIRATNSLRENLASSMSSAEAISDVSWNSGSSNERYRQCHWFSSLFIN